MSLEPLVLVVEDDADTRQALRQLLEEEGYIVEEASEGRTALERLDHHPRPALVLLDLMMPVMDGQTLLLELEGRPELASVAVVVMTASSVSEATSALNVPLLRKPVDADALLRIVEQYSPRFWDDEESPTEQVPLVGDGSGADTVKQSCSFCRERAVTRCAGCGVALCPTCAGAGYAGVCAHCWRRGRSVG